MYMRTFQQLDLRCTRLCAAAMLLLLLLPCMLHAQSHEFGPAPSDVLSPAPPDWWFGPNIGVNLVTHEGAFLTDYCQCEFRDGSGTRLTLGFELGRMFTPVIGVAVKALYNDMGAEFSYKLLIPTEVLNEGIVDVEHERKNVVKLSYFMLHPVLILQPLPFFYLFGGPAVGVTGTSTQEYTLTNVDPQFDLAVGGGDSRVVAMDSGEIPRAESLRMDLRAGLGLNLRLGRRLRFSPEVSYGIPLTTISDDDDWKAQAIHATAILKFEF